MTDSCWRGQRSTNIVVTLAMALQLGACGQAPGSARPAMPPPEVVVVTLRTQSVTLQRELPGRVSARLVAEVRPQIGGLLKKVLFTEGSMVRAGQLLYQLDDAAARAQLAASEATVLRAEASLDGAQRSAVRGTELIKAQMISVQDNDTLQVARRQAEADLAAARADLQSSRVNVAYTRVTSPIDGRIGKSAVTEGALVVANQSTPLATVQKLEQVYVDVAQSSREWLQLRRELGANATAASSKVLIILEDGQQYEPEGTLQFSDVTVDAATGSFLLRVLVPNPRGLLLPGMFVTAVIGEGVLANGLLVPQQGVTRDPKGNATTLVVGADGKVQQRAVMLIRTLGDQWLVDSGLAAGERVIVEGLQKVQPGMAVKTTEAGAAAVPPAAGS